MQPKKIWCVRCKCSLIPVRTNLPRHNIWLEKKRKTKQKQKHQQISNTFLIQATHSKTTKNKHKETKPDLAVIKLSLVLIFVLASFHTDPLDCYCQFVSWLGKTRTPNSHCSRLLKRSDQHSYSSFLYSAVRSWTAPEKEAREERVFVESPGITSQTAIKHCFHSPPRFLSTAVSMQPNLNWCFKSERRCGRIGWKQPVEIKKRGRKTKEWKDIELDMIEWQ